MKTKSIPQDFRGGKVIFAFILVALLTRFNLVGQVVENYTIYGESLWRNQGYGVENHFFRIRNYYIPNSTEYDVDPDPETGNCPYEFYTTDYMPLADPLVNDPYNTLKIRPYSVNNAADYHNGVSTLDLYAIQAHLLCSPCFENRTPRRIFRYGIFQGMRTMIMMWTRMTST